MGRVSKKHAAELRSYRLLKESYLEAHPTCEFDERGLSESGDWSPGKNCGGPGLDDASH
jgi:hypothetical protein